MLDVHRLRLLRELHRRGTIAAAAGTLGYSASAVSQHLSLLEREVGVQLLERVGRGVRLTPQALILVRHTDAVLDQLESAEAEVAASLTAIQATVRVACFQTVMLTLVPAVLADLREKAPGLRIDVVQLEPERALESLTVGDCDLVIVEEYPGQPVPRTAGVDRVDLGADRMRVALPPSMDGTRLTSLADLADRRWVLEPPGSPPWRWTITRCREAGFEPDVAFQTEDMLAHIELVLADQAVGVLPDLVWRGKPPRVPMVELPGAAHRRLVATTRRGSARHPAVVAVRRSFEGACRRFGIKPEGDGSAADDDG
ncbi:LysR family transcriptional regulator [Pseudonocardia acaciae]|uniref:LysR family transcriptional regulator n=1 Tax=Pseudonocardia acaciae TaxID=551276 RepID=UPI0007E8DBFD|nr:LysR family transcriptional regulator [Pseudonocardia acaciae]